MKPFRIFPLLIISCLFQVQGQKLWISASKDTIQIGEQFTLSVHVAHDNATEIVFPKLGQFEDLVLVSFDKEAYWAEEDRQLGQKVRVQTYIATAFGLDSTFVQVPVEVQQKSLLTQPIKLILPSTIAGKEKEGFKDITPIAGFPPDYLGWIMMIVALLFGLGLAYWLYRKYFKKVKELGAPPEIVEERIPFKIAMERLDQLKSADLANKVATEDYFVSLSDILRTYIEQEIRINAKEMTTLELLAALKNQKRLELPQEMLYRIEKNLKLADLVKFADYFPAEVESKEARSDIKKSIIRMESQIRPEF